MSKTFQFNVLPYARAQANASIFSRLARFFRTLWNIFMEARITLDDNVIPSAPAIASR